jgi:hypothetical protein
VVEAERVANRNGDLSDAHAPRIAKTRPRKRARVDPENGKVGVRIVSHEITARLAAIGQRDRQLVRPMDDVTVGEHETVGREDHTRATTTSALYANDSRGDGLDCVNDGRRIRIEQLIVVGLAK